MEEGQPVMTSYLFNQPQTRTIQIANVGKVIPCHKYSKQSKMQRWICNELKGTRRVHGIKRLKRNNHESQMLYSRNIHKRWWKTLFLHFCCLCAVSWWQGFLWKLKQIRWAKPNHNNFCFKNSSHLLWRKKNPYNSIIS